MTRSQVAKVKVCLVGDEAVGKTSLIRRFVYSTYDESYIRTVGTMVTKKDVDMPDGAHYVSLMIWDIMGRKDFIELFKDAYFKYARGIIAVFDLTRPETLLSLREWIRGIRSSMDNIPTVVLANKVDLADQILIKDVEIEKLCAALSCSWVRTSAKTGDNVEKAFHSLASEIVKTY